MARWRSRLALLRGRISVPASPRWKLLDVIEIAGMGDRFNGQAPITGLRHRFDRAGWRTDIQLGGPAEASVSATRARASRLGPAAGGARLADWRGGRLR